MGVVIDWAKVGNLIPVNAQKPEKPASAEGEGEGKEKAEGEEKGDGETREGSSKDVEMETKEEVEVEEDQEEPELTWSDVALSIGAEIVAECRNAVHEKLGYTCSAGIAPNKVRFAFLFFSELSADSFLFADARQTLLRLEEAQRADDPSLLLHCQLLETHGLPEDSQSWWQARRTDQGGLQRRDSGRSTACDAARAAE